VGQGADQTAEIEGICVRFTEATGRPPNAQDLADITELVCGPAIPDPEDEWFEQAPSPKRGVPYHKFEHAPRPVDPEWVASEARAREDRATWPAAARISPDNRGAWWYQEYMNPDEIVPQGFMGALHHRFHEGVFVREMSRPFWTGRP